MSTLMGAFVGGGCDKDPKIDPIIDPNSARQAAWLSVITHPSVVDVCSGMFVSKKSIPAQIRDRLRVDSMATTNHLKLVDTLQYHIHHSGSGGGGGGVGSGSSLMRNTLTNGNGSGGGTGSGNSNTALLEVKSTRRLLVPNPNPNTDADTDTDSHSINPDSSPNSSLSRVSRPTTGFKCGTIPLVHRRRPIDMEPSLPCYRELYTLYTNTNPNPIYNTTNTTNTTNTHTNTHTNAHNTHTNTHTNAHDPTPVPMCDISNMCTWIQSVILPHTQSASIYNSTPTTVSTPVSKSNTGMKFKLKLNAVWKKELERNTYA